MIPGPMYSNPVVRLYFKIGIGAYNTSIAMVMRIGVFALGQYIRHFMLNKPCFIYWKYREVGKFLIY